MDEVLSDVHVYNKFDLLPDKSCAITRFEFYLPISQETVCKLDSVEPPTKRVKWCNSEEDKQASEALDLSTSTESVSSIPVDKDGDLVLERNSGEHQGSSGSETSEDSSEDDFQETVKAVQKRRHDGMELSFITLKHSLATELDQVGEQVWLGALLLCDYIIYKSGELTNKTVVDLGSGTGLTSIMAALFAKAVYCTDVGENVLDIAKYNVDNQIHFREDCPGCVLVKELDWFKPIQASDNVKPYGLNKEDVSKLYKAQVIIAADVIYDNDKTDAFISTVMSLMSSPPNKKLFIGLEKRLVFTIEDLDIASPAYKHFRKKLNDCVGVADKDKVTLRVEQIETDFAQYFSYNRINQLWLSHPEPERYAEILWLEKQNRLRKNQGCKLKESHGHESKEIHGQESREIHGQESKENQKIMDMKSSMSLLQRF